MPHIVFPGTPLGEEMLADMDVISFDNSKTMKEEASHTCKGFAGYEPMVAYIDTEDFMANIELHERKKYF